MNNPFFLLILTLLYTASSFAVHVTSSLSHTLTFAKNESQKLFYISLRNAKLTPERVKISVGKLTMNEEGTKTLTPFDPNETCPVQVEKENFILFPREGLEVKVTATAPKQLTKPWYEGVAIVVSSDGSELIQTDGTKSTLSISLEYLISTHLQKGRFDPGQVQFSLKKKEKDHIILSMENNSDLFYLDKLQYAGFNDKEAVYENTMDEFTILPHQKRDIKIPIGSEEAKRLQVVIDSPRFEFSKFDVDL